MTTQFNVAIWKWIHVYKKIIYLNRNWPVSGIVTNSNCDQLPVGLIAQLVEHYRHLFSVIDIICTDHQKAPRGVFNKVSYLILLHFFHWGHQFESVQTWIFCWGTCRQCYNMLVWNVVSIWLCLSTCIWQPMLLERNTFLSHTLL